MSAISRSAPIARTSAPSFDQIIQSWDTANKPSQFADYSVCAAWSVKGPNF
jgi:phage terminase large subunit-like protein